MLAATASVRLSRWAEGAATDVLAAMAVHAGRTLLDEAQATCSDELSPTRRERWRARTKSLVAHEWQALSGCGIQSAHDRVAFSLAPRRVTLPAQRAMLSGAIGWWDASQWWQRCRSMPVENAAEVAAEVFDRRRSRAELLQVLDRAAVRAEGRDRDTAHEAAQRRQREVDRRGAWLTLEDTGVGTITITGRTSATMAAMERVHHLARRARSAGDSRTLGQLRSDAAMALLLGGTLPSATRPHAHGVGSTPSTSSGNRAEDVDSTGGHSPVGRRPSSPPTGPGSSATGSASSTNGPSSGGSASNTNGGSNGNRAEDIDSTGNDSSVGRRPSSPPIGPPPIGPGRSGTGSASSTNGPNSGNSASSTDSPDSDGPGDPGSTVSDAPPAGDPEHSEADDILGALLQGFAPARVNVTVPLDALLSGALLSGTGDTDTSDPDPDPGPSAVAAGGSSIAFNAATPGVGMMTAAGCPTLHLDAGQARELVLTPGTVLHRLVTDPVTGAALERSRSSYAPDAQMRDLVQAADHSCRAPGCTVPASVVDLDHVVPYPDGATSVANLVSTHRGHHNLKTAGWWSAVIDDRRALTWTTLFGALYRTEAFDFRDLERSPVSPGTGDARDALEDLTAATVNADRPTWQSRQDLMDRLIYAALAHREPEAPLEPNEVDDPFDSLRGPARDLSRGPAPVDLRHRDGARSRPGAPAGHPSPSQLIAAVLSPDQAGAGADAVSGDDAGSDPIPPPPF